MEVPPVMATGVGDALPPQTGAPWRWWVWCAILTPYPIVLGTLPILLKHLGGISLDTQSVLPSTTRELGWVAAENLGLFFVLLLLAWIAARPSPGDLFLSGGVRIPGRTLSSYWLLPLGILYSIGVRIPVSLCLGMAIGVAYLLNHGDPAALQAYRPKIEEVIDPSALADPLYFFLTLTLLSFVVAGFREELWRTAVLVGLLRILPSGWQGRKGWLLVLTVSSLVFGLGHLPQGPAGVLATTILGFLLGGITLYHRSLWLAVLAHGFFDAASFAILRLVQQYGLLDQMLGK